MNGELKQQLSRFIIDELTKGEFSDTDPKPLLAYIMALITQEKPKEELKAYCVSQLSEFLGNSTSDFVSKLFTHMDALKRRQTSKDSTAVSERRSRDHDRTRKRKISTDSEELSDNEEERSFKRKRRDSDAVADISLGDIMYESGGSRRSRRDKNYGHSERESTHWDDRRVKRGLEDNNHIEMSRLPPPQHPVYQRMPYPMHQLPPPISMGPGSQSMGMMPPFPQMPIHPSEQVYARGGPVGFKGIRGRGRGRDQRGSSVDKKKPRNTCTLDIVGIPKELNTLPNLVSHFDQFGTIVNIQVRPEVDRATVQYSSPYEAKTAISSPEAVLGNRFIKVYWAKDKDEPGRQGSDRTEASLSSDKPPEPVPQLTKSHPKLNTDPRTLSLSNKKTEVKSVELMKKRDDLLADLMAKQDEILSVLTKFKDKIDEVTQTALKTQLREINGQITQMVSDKEKELAKAAIGAEVLHSTDGGSQQPSEISTADSSSRVRQEKLQKTLDELRKETAARGIDPSQPIHRGRGTYRGRGVRGRGSYTRPSQRTIDNRTSKLSTPIPESLSSEALQTHLSSFGKIESFEVQDGVATVTYSNRRDAESAIRGGQTVNSQNLALQWVRRDPGRPFLQDDDAEAGTDAVQEVRVDHEDEEESFHYFDAEEEEDWKR